MLDERREFARRRALKSAKVSFGGSVIDCVIRDFSATGASLEVASPVGIPEKFVLMVGAEPGRPCRVIWRREKRIGVRFERPIG